MSRTVTFTTLPNVNATWCDHRKFVRFVQGRSKYLSLCSRSPSGCFHHNRENAGTCRVNITGLPTQLKLQIPSPSPQDDCCVSRCCGMFDVLRTKSRALQKLQMQWQNPEAGAEWVKCCQMFLCSVKPLAEFLKVVTLGVSMFLSTDWLWKWPEMMEWDQAPELRLRFEALHKVGASRTIKGISEGSFQSVIWMQTAGEDHGSLKWIGVTRCWGMLPYREGPPNRSK